MTPAVRKLNLTAHIVSSVGWLGAVACFLVLSIAGLSSQDAELVRGAYLAMNLIGQFIIVPLSLAALLTGLVHSLGTHWGLFRHYWVLVKFALTIGAGIALLLHQFTAVAGAARRVSEAAGGTLPELGGLGRQLLGDAGLAALVLLVITTLSVYKPWGRTGYGRRKQAGGAASVTSRDREAQQTPGGVPTTPPPTLPDRDKGLPVGLKIFIAVIGVLVVGFIVLHLASGGLAGHGR